MALEQVIQSWRDYESVQTAFRRLKRKSKTKTLAYGTEKAYEIWIPRFMDFTKMNPDQLIEEGLKNPDLAEDRLADFYSAISTKQLTYARKISNNSLRTSIYGHLRGFYTKNKVNTNGWTTPILEIPQVDDIDSNYPLFLINPKTDKLDLNRELLSTYFRSMSQRDETIALCLMSSGLDTSDILDLTIGDIDVQSNQKRIFLTTNRRKTSEMAKSFLTIEATQRIRKYIRDYRKGAKDEERVFVCSISVQKRMFSDKYGRRATLEDELDAVPTTPQDVARSFRIVQEKKLGLRIKTSQQSPLRPKRLRKVFKSACTRAGLSDDMIRVFMGQSSLASKVYLGKSREELESYYVQVEPFLTLYKNENKDEELEFLQKQNQELIKRIEALEEKQFGMNFPNRIQ